MELNLEGGTMAEGRSAQVEGKTSSLGGGNPGLWIIPIHPPLPGLPPGFLHHCPRTTPSPVTSRWPEGQRTGKSHWKDVCWLTGTPKTWQSQVCLVVTP